MPARLVAPALVALVGAGCVEEPSLLCDFERVVWSLEEVEVGPEQDISDDQGLQIDVTLRTTLSPGVQMRLNVLDADGVVAGSAEEHLGRDGSVSFPAVTLPAGKVTLEASAYNDCRLVQASREIFVFDGMGRPECALSLEESAVTREALAPLRVLNAAADSDPDAADFQAHFQVAAGRPDIEVRLLRVDLESSVESALEQVSGEDRRAEFEVTLGQGQHAVRAVCFWEEAAVQATSATRTYLVDTLPPGCELVEPQGPVGAGDDRDGDPENGIQFDLLGRASGGDVEGEPAVFTVEGEDFEGSSLDALGESTAVGELPDPPPQSQEVSFEAGDRAGNRCEVIVELQ